MRSRSRVHRERKKFDADLAHLPGTAGSSGIEPVMTGGMDNPSISCSRRAATPSSTTTFFQHPRDGKHGGLPIPRGLWRRLRRDHDVVYEHPWTSPQLMPVLTHMGPAAPCGLHRLSSEFGKDYANNVFCCQFNLRKVTGMCWCRRVRRTRRRTAISWCRTTSTSTRRT
ncbi:MAG: hypothetical protein U0792_03910 [Gemmataceae bacterium]